MLKGTVCVNTTASHPARRGGKPIPYYSRLSPNGHLYKTDTSVKRTPRVGPCFSLLPLFDSL